MYALKLQYSALLLYLIRRQAARRQPIWDLCDRFERVMASIPRHPLVWEGDYA